MQSLLQERWPECSYDLAFYVVAEPEMIRLNEDFLRHNGATDVITFDYAEEVGQASCRATSGANIRTTGGGRDVCAVLIHGEIFICVDEALCQARRFRTTWQSELVRYAVHGVLHLLGYDDLNVRARRKMKAAENEIVRQLARQFSFRSLDATSAVNRT
ncbi:MAG: rRNA maturation RNase YbeY [Verrucomicrobia bacterium]|nr:rRNA maturation RNase YbeY [Verrucomicrobiota bacterium]